MTNRLATAGRLQNALEHIQIIKVSTSPTQVALGGLDCYQLSARSQEPSIIFRTGR